ncbi:hypothetical protein [Lentisalinibacter sediminis]|uniref:hypothetical protein n=1 Tax=Lentisalinibacter sediminis TaxID=2992237 RepID=UPI00386D2587
MTDEFIRSSAGLKNKHLFHDVDLVVYVEGGSEEGRPPAVEFASYDELFWTIVITSFVQTEVKIKVQCHGSKNNLIAIAKKIATEELTGVFVAMDRDYDDFSGEGVEGGGVLRTFGYSWESDVWDADVCIRVFRKLRPIGDRALAEEMAIECYDALERTGRFIAWADSVLYCSGQPLLATRYEKEFICSDADHRPYIDSKRVRTRLRQSRKRCAKKQLMRQSIRGIRGVYDLRGKFLAAFSVKLINGMLRTQGARGAINVDLVTGLALDELADSLANDAEKITVTDYYKSLMEHVSEAA